MLRRYVPELPFLALFWFAPFQTRASVLTLSTTRYLGRSRDSLYQPELADSEREAVADLLQFLENVSYPSTRSATVLFRAPPWLTPCASSVARPTSSLASLYGHSAL